MSKLTAMSKDGETIGVHPSLVADHESLGWVAGGEFPVARDTLDHDGDGRKGGAPKPADDAGELATLRAEYEAKLGKKPFMGWSADELTKRIAEAG